MSGRHDPVPHVRICAINRFFTRSTVFVIEHYVNILGAYHFGGHLMIIDTIAAKRLVDKYFKPE